MRYDLYYGERETLKVVIARREPLKETHKNKEFSIILINSP
jgi:hypothetical protein